MVISNIPEAFLTSLFDFNGSIFSAHFSTCSICKFFFSATLTATVKKKYSEDIEIILPYDLQMTAGFQSCRIKSAERSINK